LPAEKDKARPLRIWALLGARTGDNNQVLALAEALGLPFEIKRLEYNRLQWLGPRLLGRSLISLTPASRETLLRDPPPDLTISTGHRAVAAVQHLRRRSGGSTRSLHVGFPRISPAKFDLVIATPEYPIADHPNLLRIPLPLTRSKPAPAHGIAAIDALPRPRRLLIVGGPTLFWAPTAKGLGQSLDTLRAAAERDGGSVMVIGSPRTPPELEESMRKRLKRFHVPTLLAPARGDPSYPDLLAAADLVFVTADSVSMSADAIATGKPVGLVPVAPTLGGRIAMALMRVIAPGRRLYPRDPRFFWRELNRLGLVGSVAAPRCAPVPDVNGLVLAAVAQILAGL
jgi:mitochondrial fission protein ELM1